MLNSENVYFECGRKAGRARSQRDEARAQFAESWFRRAKALENDKDRPYAEASFRDGYRHGTGMPYA